MRQATLIVFLLTLMTTTCFAAVYKWTNEDGVTTFSQHPPSNRATASQKITIKHSNAPEEVKKAPSSEESAKAIAESNAKRAAEQAEKKQALAEQAQIKQRCTNANKNLEALNFGGNRLYKGADGEYKRFNQEDKKQKEQQIREFLKEFCQ